MRKELTWRRTREEHFWPTLQIWRKWANSPYGESLAGGMDSSTGMSYKCEFLFIHSLPCVAYVTGIETTRVFCLRGLFSTFLRNCRVNFVVKSFRCNGLPSARSVASSSPPHHRHQAFSALYGHKTNTDFWLAGEETLRFDSTTKRQAYFKTIMAGYF